MPFGQCSAAVFLAHLALAELYHLGYHGIHLRIGSRVDDLHALDIEAAPLQQQPLTASTLPTRMESIRPSLLQACSRFEDTSIRAFGEYDLALVSL